MTNNEPRNTNNEVRVRFAPSPTGYLHVGGLRTALYNYFYARRHNGKFILRIEDTDQTRKVEGAIEGIIDMLSWSGLAIDEGPHVGGPYGPYTQSERLALYKKSAEELIELGKAYYCFCTAEKLDESRKKAVDEKRPPMYDRTCRSIPLTEARERAKSEAHVVRMKVPLTGETIVRDEVRGEVRFSNATIDDQVLMKSDGFPTYHLANVVDDFSMHITHVIRGEEWLPSTPKHVILYEAFGWKAPAFAHLPLLLNPDKSKLSKRNADVAAEDYRKKGYFCEALVNFLSLLGFNPTGDREIYSMDELIAAFDLSKVNKAGAVFNLEKLEWMNAEYLRAKPDEQVADEVLANAKAKGWNPTPDYATKVVHLMKERVHRISDYTDFASYFFTDVQTFDETYKAKIWKEDSPAILRDLHKRLSALTDFSHARIEELVRAYATELNVKAGVLIHLLRYSLTGTNVGAGMFETMEVLGQDETLRRIEKFS